MRTDAAGSNTALLPHSCLFVSKEGTGPRTRTEAAHWSGGLVRTRIFFSFFQNPSVQQIDSLRYFFSQTWVITTRATAIRLMHYSTSERNTDEHWFNLDRQLGAVSAFWNLPDRSAYVFERINLKSCFQRWNCSTSWNYRKSAWKSWRPWASGLGLGGLGRARAEQPESVRKPWHPMGQGWDSKDWWAGVASCKHPREGGLDGPGPRTAKTRFWRVGPGRARWGIGDIVLAPQQRQHSLDKAIRFKWCNLLRYFASAGLATHEPNDVQTSPWHLMQCQRYHIKVLLDSPRVVSSSPHPEPWATSEVHSKKS